MTKLGRQCDYVIVTWEFRNQATPPRLAIEIKLGGNADPAPFRPHLLGRACLAVPLTPSPVPSVCLILHVHPLYSVPLLSHK